jgi:hypothetical protein
VGEGGPPLTSPVAKPIGQTSCVFDPTSGNVMLCLLGSYPSSLPPKEHSRPEPGALVSRA